MNGRTVFAVNRSPVLAWNVEPQPLPYADMPAAAAAAISPADPYARCWQNQVEAGSGFSYFGALYNNSLPPTAYRLQPGCMANLGQFWPPTPPPDGCGRYDGSNLYLGPHVFRHGENIPSNLRNSYQGLGHYSHVVEASKESSQRTFKRETPVSPNVNTSGISIGSSVSKSENLNTFCVTDSKLKPQVSISSNLPKQEIISASSSSHEPYMCASDSRGSSSMHPSNDKACFSPPYSLKSTLNFQNHSQDTSAHKFKTLSSTQENTYNASPLKNVYFSNIESENVNSVLNKKFKSGEDHYRFEPKNVPLDMHKLRNSSNFMLHNPYASKKYDVPVSQEYCNVNTNCKLRTEKQTDCVVVVGEQQYKQKSNVCRVKPEKSAHSDCKYQRPVKNQSMLHMPDYRTSSEVFNIPTSMMHSKLEPNEKYFLSNCSSTVPSCMTNSYVNSGSYLLSKDFTPAYHNMVYPNSCSLSKPWHVSELPVVSPDNYLKAPEAAKPPTSGSTFTSPVTHEELVSVAQTAPPEMDVIRMNGKMQQGSRPKGVLEHHDDDEVQIISVQTKQSPVSKSNSRHLLESKPSQSPPVSIVAPLCLKSEKEPENKDKEVKNSLISSIENNTQWIKSEPVPPVLEKEEPDNRITSSELDAKIEASELECASKEPPMIRCEVISIKQEVTQTESSDNCDILQAGQKVCEVSEAINKTSEKPQLSPEKIDDSSNTSKMPDLQEEHCKNVPISDFNDNHNLNLLLNTIEKVTSLENTHTSNTVITVKSEPIVDAESDIKSLGTSMELPKPCGLDLLSVIAGQRLVSEFDSVNQNEDIKSNYPLIMKDEQDVSEQTRPQCDSSPNLQKASVFEMQAKLAELQKKYKQKQKEVSRLKPKKRFTSMFFNGKKKDDHEMSLGLNNDSSDLNGSACSTSADDLQILDDQGKDTSIRANTPKADIKCVEESPESRRKFLRKRTAEESSSQPPEKQIRTRSSSRHSIKLIRSDDNCSNPLEHSHSAAKPSKDKGYQLRKTKSSETSNSLDDDIQIIGIGDNSSDKTKESHKKFNSENDKKLKAYSLRHLAQQNKQDTASCSTDTALSLKSITSKRKSDNPKKYMPSKQGKLSETIIAKHLRNRILFDTSGSMSDDDAQDGGVPEELYDALMKCHLEDQSKKDGSSSTSESPKLHLATTEPRMLKLENLVVKQRLLTLDDGLFYAGYIKEVQASNRYGIMLDGRRGNRLQSYSQEELLTQAVVESKPLSSELPVGTRVCAFWSRDYWCMYPGIVGKASCPSHDWSEPRVFVLFDDGDTAQIATKNIRLIPPDIIPLDNSNDSDSPTEQLQSSSDTTCDPVKRSRRLRCSTSNTPSVKDCDISNENESKDSSCASVNDSSCDDSCFIEYSLSPSQNLDNFTRIENSASCSFSNDTDTTKLEKRQKKRSKRKTSSRTKLKEDTKEKSDAKAKRHKKYKEKHRKHHHHHHHHHRHHHHHHHSKKHKHKKKTEKNLTPQNSDKANSIPYSVNHKAFKNCQKDAEACTNHVEHSSTVNLPQNNNDSIC